MPRILHRFIHDTAGTISLDWVLVAVAAIGMGLLATVSITTSTHGIGSLLASSSSFEPRFIRSRQAWVTHPQMTNAAVSCGVCY